MAATVLGRYDEPAVRERFAQAGILHALERKGFRDLQVVIDTAGRALPHALLFGRKAARRLLLLDACIGEAVIRPDFFRARGYAATRSMYLAVVHWVREEDPTAAFTPDRPRLPLQEHPGLGILRQAFRVAAGMARELGKDGVASVPKFFHDAVIFYRSRLFLFLDGREQGCFEALLRDLRHLSLREATLSVASGRVRSAEGAPVQWRPGYQVFPVSGELADYLHSDRYAAAVRGGAADSRFTIAPLSAAAAADVR